MPSVGDVEGEVFERAHPRPLRAVFVATLVVALGIVVLSPFARRRVRDLATQLPWVDQELFDGLLSIAPLGGFTLLLLVGTSWAARRYGRAVITRDHIVIAPIAPTFRKIVVPRDDVRSLRETPHGVLLDAPLARRFPLRLWLPPFVPAGDADLARAHALLDPGRRSPRPEASASGVLSNLAIAAVSVPVFMFLGAVAWSTITDKVGDVLQGVAVLAAVVLAVLVAAPGRRRVHLGEDTVSLGNVCGAWSDVRTFAAWSGWLAVTFRGRRALAHVGRDAVARLTPLARAKVAVDEVAPAWARRRRIALAGSFGLLLAFYTGVGPIAAITTEHTVWAVDHHGYGVQIYYRAVDARPRLVVVVDTSNDLRRWRRPELADATVVRVRADRLDVSTGPLPTPRDWPHGADGRPAQVDRGLDLLEDWFPDTTDPLLRDLLDGRTTTRCFAVKTSDGWLLTQVRDGAVLAAGVMVLDERKGWWRREPCVTCEGLRTGDPRNVVAAAVRWCEPRPSLEQVLAAQRLVRRGVSLAEATAGWTR